MHTEMNVSSHQYMLYFIHMNTIACKSFSNMATHIRTGIVSTRAGKMPWLNPPRPLAVPEPSPSNVSKQKGRGINTSILAATGAAPASEGVPKTRRHDAAGETRFQPHERFKDGLHACHRLFEGHSDCQFVFPTFYVHKETYLGVVDDFEA